MKTSPFYARLFRDFLQGFHENVSSNRKINQNRPYPISIQPKQRSDEEIRSGWGPETFRQQDYININNARLEHLESLNLPLDGKSVLDVGCGVGDLTQFFLNKNCEVVCVDGREENISVLHSEHPKLIAHIANVETDLLSKFGNFDIVFCYGLLYHLENPFIALHNMALVCKELLLLETIVCDHKLPILRITDESAAFSQALQGVGCRPSPSYVVLALNRSGFPYVYAPKKLPHHRDFQFEWKNDLGSKRNGNNLRCIFIASRIKLDNANLINLIED